MPVNPDLKLEAIELLKKLIATPSFSKEEDRTAEILATFLNEKQIPFSRVGNNVWALAKNWKNDRPIVLLNSHHDTVRPVSGWQKSPFEPTEEDGKIYGLGSNDAGASLVSLAAVFVHFYEAESLPFNLVFLASAEEEISGSRGVALAIPEIGRIDFAIVGEPTEMQMAVAEKGLMVIDGEAKGTAGHAAREEGVNAIYLALKDIEQLRNIEFEQTSDLLGPVKVSVTQIAAGIQHNVVPDKCSFVVDVRTNEHYQNQKAFEILQSICQSKLTARSFRLNSSCIPLDHPLVKSGKSLGLAHFGSPTLSDQALMPFPTLKLGPGDSARSHTADEYIFREEIEKGMEIYRKLIEGISIKKKHHETLG